MIYDWETTAKSSEEASKTPIDIPASIGGPPRMSDCMTPRDEFYAPPGHAIISGPHFWVQVEGEPAGVYTCSCGGATWNSITEPTPKPLVKDASTRFQTSEISAQVGGVSSVGSRGWQPTEDRREGWVVYINPRTREVAVEVDGNRLVPLEALQSPAEPPLLDTRPQWSLSPERARQIAAECPLRWQDVRRIAEEHSQMGYAGWMKGAPVDEVAEFIWSCWLDAHTEEGG